MTIIEWLKEKLGIITSGDLRKYRKNIQFQFVHEDKRSYYENFRRTEERILRNVFSRFKQDEPFIDSLRALFLFSPVFQEIVLTTFVEVIDRSNADVNVFLRHAPNFVLSRSRQRKNEIFSSISDTQGFLKFSIDLPITYGKERHTTREGWNRFVRMLGYPRGRPRKGS